MAPLKSNRLLPVIAGVAVALGILVFVFGGSKSSNPRGMTHIPQAGAPPASADTPADTIRTLTARVAGANQRMDHLAQQNDALQRQNQRLLSRNQNLQNQKQSITSAVTRQVARRLKQNRQSKRSVLSALTRRIDTLGQQIHGLTTTDQSGAAGTAANYPVQGAQPDYVWVAALDRDGDKAHVPPSNSLLHGLKHSASIAAKPSDHGDRASRHSKPHDAIRPAATVPANATLIGSTAMTALLGIVPKAGSVRDPAHFKVLTGAKNLAAQGFTIPGLVGAVWSGTAIGDWTLSCVRARVDSVTFVFADGTIRTISDDRHDRGRDNGKRLRANNELGYISDAHGIPCIGGTRHSDFPQFLVNVAAASALQGAGAALANGETTRTASGLTGTVTSTLTGNTGRYILGQTAASAANQVVQYLLARQKDHFDSVFVRAGHRVAVHIERELHIDYDPKGRKLSYGNPLHTSTLPLWISLGLLSLILVAGCAPTQEAILPEDGPTMAQIYRQHMQRPISPRSPRRARGLPVILPLRRTPQRRFKPPRMAAMANAKPYPLRFARSTAAPPTLPAIRAAPHAKIRHCSHGSPTRHW
jgi:integrating conjugative element protein (TIGR03752 family)